MVRVSKAMATGKNGKLLKGYKVVVSKTGQKLYFTDTYKKKPRKVISDVESDEVHESDELIDLSYMKYLKVKPNY